MRNRGPPVPVKVRNDSCGVTVRSVKKSDDEFAGFHFWAVSLGQWTFLGQVKRRILWRALANHHHHDHHHHHQHHHHQHHHDDHCKQCKHHDSHHDNPGWEGAGNDGNWVVDCCLVLYCVPKISCKTFEQMQALGRAIMYHNAMPPSGKVAGSFFEELCKIYLVDFWQLRWFTDGPPTFQELAQRRTEAHGNMTLFEPFVILKASLLEWLGASNGKKDIPSKCIKCFCCGEKPFFDRVEISSAPLLEGDQTYETMGFQNRHWINFDSIRFNDHYSCGLGDR